MKQAFKRFNLVILVFVFGVIANANPVFADQPMAVAKGDVNGDGKVDLADAVLMMQLSVLVPSEEDMFKAADVDQDGRVGLVEAIYALQIVAGIREPEPAWNESFTNSLGMTFKLIPAGTFTMGSPTNELGRNYDETQHQVTLTQFYYMQTTEVTQGQWRAVTGSNPSYFSSCGDDCPVEQVSWDDVQSFISALNNLGQGTYRLPTEAEWEYAARAGSTTAFANGGITELYCGYDPNLDAMGWYCYNASFTTHPVGLKQPNDWGLYDMHGNVWEWCQDLYGDYPSSAVTDPTGPSSGSDRVLRGGGWYFYAGDCRSANRGSSDPSDRNGYDGFRLVCLQVP